MKNWLKVQYNALKPPQILTAFLSTLLVVSNTCSAQALPLEVMVDLGTLSSGTRSSANGVSADGSVIAGYSEIPGGNSRAFKYTVAGGMVSLGTLGGITSAAYGVSADGSVIVGDSHTALNRSLAFKYTDAGGMVSLGSLGGSTSAAYGVSADGSVIVGESGTGSSIPIVHAFKYTDATGMVDLNTLGGSYSSALGVSADGSVIVGYSQITNDTATHAFKYTDATGMVSLGTLGGNRSIAHGVSADGSVIVGDSLITVGSSTSHAFKYVGTTMTDLGTLGGADSVARAVSADGSVIVGDSLITVGSSTSHAFKYQDGVMTDLGTLGGTFSRAHGVSGDGSVIVGEAETTSGNYHAFVYRNRVTSPLADLVSVNNTYAALAASGFQLNSVLSSQANLLNVGLSDDYTLVWAGNSRVGVDVDVANNAANRLTSSPVNRLTSSQAVVNLRTAYRVSPNFHVGVFVTQSTWDNLPSNYDLKKNRPLMGIFAGWSENSNGIGAKVRGSVAYSKRDLDITRLTLANTEAGKGRSKLTAKGAQIEAAYGIALNKDWITEPFLGVRVSEISRGAYQENNVGFPISYNAVKQTATTAYIGARLTGKITPAITARLSAGVGSDLRHRNSDNTGTIDFLGPYVLSAPKALRTRGFVSGSLGYAITSNQAISAGVAVSQNAFDHELGVTASVNYAISF